MRMLDCGTMRKRLMNTRQKFNYFAVGEKSMDLRVSTLRTFHMHLACTDRLLRYDPTIGTN